MHIAIDAEYYAEFACLLPLMTPIRCRLVSNYSIGHMTTWVSQVRFGAAIQISQWEPSADITLDFAGWSCKLASVQEPMVKAPEWEPMLGMPLVRQPTATLTKIGKSDFTAKLGPEPGFAPGCARQSAGCIPTHVTFIVSLEPGCTVPEAMRMRPTIRCDAFALPPGPPSPSPPPASPVPSPPPPSPATPLSSCHLIRQYGVTAPDVPAAQPPVSTSRSGRAAHSQIPLSDFLRASRPTASGRADRSGYPVAPPRVPSTYPSLPASAGDAVGGSQLTDTSTQSFVAMLDLQRWDAGTM